MDDIAFFDTSLFGIRGGIFSEAGKLPRDQAGVETAPESTIQPGDVVMAAEDPSSAVPEVPTLRQRHLAKSQTLDTTHPIEILQVETSERMPRKEAPPNAVLGIPKRPPEVNATKQTNQLDQSASLSSQAESGGPRNGLQEGVDWRLSIAEADKSASDLVDKSAIGDTQIVSRQSPMNGGNASSSLTGAISSQLIGERSTLSLPKSSTDSARSSTDDLPVIPVAENAAEIPSTAALLNSIRTRDKKAIQSQVNTARDAVKKWGVNWAAKRRTNLPDKLDERDENHPAALYLPPENQAGPSGLGKSPESPNHAQTLKERLDAAAHSPPNRARSASSSSRNSTTGSKPALLSTQPKSAVAPGEPSTMPLKLTVASSRSSSEILRDSVAGPNSSWPTSGGSVSTQPSAGRTMIVPRVPKRPGEVTGIGSHPVEGIVRRISADDRLDAENGSSVPPPRASMEERIASQQGFSAVPPLIDLETVERLVPAASTSNMDDPISTDDLSEPVRPLTARTPSPGEEFVRSESAPPIIRALPSHMEQTRLPSRPNRDIEREIDVATTGSSMVETNKEALMNGDESMHA